MKTPFARRTRRIVEEAGSVGTAMATEGRLTVVTGLQEAALKAERRAVEVVVLRPGRSLNGNYYSREVVAAVAGLMEGARAFADHNLASPLRSMRDLVGYYADAHVGGDGVLRATLHVSKNADWLWTIIQEALEAKQPHLVGISVDLQGSTVAGTIDGLPTRVVTAVQALNSADVVSRASAGGHVERLLQADNQSWWDSWQPANEEGPALQDASAATGASIASSQRPVDGPAGWTPGATSGPGAHVIYPPATPVQGGPTVAAIIDGGWVLSGDTYLVEGEDAEMKTRRANELRAADGARGSAAPTTGPAAAPAVGGVTTAVQITEEERTALADLGLARQVLECEKTLHHTLSGSGLPGPVVRSLNERFTGRVFEAHELDGAVAAQRGILAELTDLGMIRGMGYERQASVGRGERERIQAAFDGLFDIQEGAPVAPLTGIREAYVLLTGDVNVNGVTEQARLQEADVTTSSFSFLLGTSMNKRLLKDYQAWPCVQLEGISIAHLTVLLPLLVGRVVDKLWRCGVCTGNVKGIYTGDEKYRRQTCR